jgi:hypothetical protein
MYYVYCRHLGTGRESFVNLYDTEKDAVSKIASCYAIDSQTCQQGEYYYFLMKH